MNAEALTITFTVNERDYLQEDISALQTEGKICCNRNALSYAMIDSAKELGIDVSDALAIIHWNQPGEFYGKSYCKIYVERKCYQAEIPEWQVQKILNGDVFTEKLTFALIPGRD